MQLERISLWQFTLIIFIMRAVLSLATMPMILSEQKGGDSWVASILFILVGVPIALFYVKLAERHPDQTIFEYANTLLGPVWGRLVTAPLLWGFLHYSSVILREYGEATVTAVLPQTPLVFIMGCMILVCAVGVRLGIEVLGRSAELLVPLFAVSTVTVILLAVPLGELAHLTPVGVAGLGPIIRGGIAPSTYYFLFAVILVIYPSLNKKRFAGTSAVLASVSAATLVGLAAAVAVAIFGSEEAARLLFPFLSMARLVQVAEFVERIEAVTGIAWGAGLFLELSVVFYAGARGLGLWLGIVDHRRLVFPMGAILLTLSLVLFPNAFEISDFQTAEVLGPYGLLMIFGPPGVVWIASLLRGRSKAAPGQNGESLS